MIVVLAPTLMLPLSFGIYKLQFLKYPSKVGGYYWVPIDL